MEYIGYILSEVEAAPVFSTVVMSCSGSVQGLMVQCRHCRSPSKSIHGCHSVPKRCVDMTLTTEIVRLLVLSRGPISMA